MLKRLRGCGQRPEIEGQTFDLVSWLEAQAASGATHSDIVSHVDGEFYLANRGDVFTVLGWLWPQCPRWYLTYGDRVAIEVAGEIVELRKLVKLGLGAHLGEQLTQGGLDLLDKADRLSTRLQRDYEKEQLDAARERAK